jgi:ArsR family transcriptional regulator, arsenate/arsenite/antimonite-responsive transcriptional repressor
MPRQKRKAAAPEREDERLANLCRALAHHARVRILKLLIERNGCVCGEIVEVVPLAQSTVSEHLRILKAAGLIQGEVEGLKVCYCVDPKAVRELRSLLATLSVG